MSGIEVVAAVSAVISAFHGGSELLKHIKKKRRRSRSKDQTQQDFEERQLQESLITGEQQIGLRYASDMKELGELVRVGDATAYHRLQHIAIIMQAEIIKSLQLAVQYENAILNLKILHETSIVNRKDTFGALDELKQRILITRMPRTLDNVPDSFRHSSSTPSVHTVGTLSYSSIPDNYIPSAVSLSLQEDSKEARSGLARYFHMKRSNSESSISAPPTLSSSPPPNPDFSAALEQLVNARGKEDRAAIMRDIDDIITSYQQLNMGHDPVDLWGANDYSGGSSSHGSSKRDTLAILNGGYASKRDTKGLQWDAMQMLRNLPPMEEHNVERTSEYPAFNQHIFNPHHEQHAFQPPYIARNPLPQLQTQEAHHPRWSSASGASSSGFSDTTPPSLYRNNSTSSDGSHMQSSPMIPDVTPEFSRFPPPPSFPVNSSRPLDEHRGIGSHLQSQIPNAVHEHGYSPPRAPIAPHTQADSTTNAPSFSMQQAGTSPYALPQHLSNAPYSPLNVSRAPKEEDSIHASRQYQHQPPVPDTISTHSNSSGRTVTPSIAQAAAAASSTVLAPAIGRPLKPTTTNLSVASSNSSNSLTISNPHPIRPIPIAVPTTTTKPSISSGTIQGPPTGRDRMMIGRPNRDNDYWGFCKGAWACREDNKKGLTLQNQPSGMYNTLQIWECRHCNFRGEAHSIPHRDPKKASKGKRETIMDPKIHVSSSGIRYRWQFLAKSHVKKKDNAVLKKSAGLTNEACFGCLVCSVLGRVTGVYGNVETLMNHLVMEHSAIEENVQGLSGCVVGRVAGKEEEWDVNIPSGVEG